MDGCDQDFDDECVVHYDTVVHGKLYFTNYGTKANVIDCKIYGKIGVWVPFPGDCPVANGCDALEQGSCPLEEGEEVVYDISLKIEDFFPPVRLLVVTLLY